VRGQSAALASLVDAAPWPPRTEPGGAYVCSRQAAQRWTLRLSAARCLAASQRRSRQRLALPR
jgi:hypothetical protein